jgi:hypothetical protein
MGHTHIRLAAASGDVLTGVLRTAWKLRRDKNAQTSPRKRVALREKHGVKSTEIGQVIATDILVGETAK